VRVCLLLVACESDVVACLVATALSHLERVRCCFASTLSKRKNLLSVRSFAPCVRFSPLPPATRTPHLDQMHSLSNFTFTRVLNEDPVLKTINILGTLPSADDASIASNDRQDAILLIEKTHFAAQSATSDITHRMAELLSTGCNDIYFWWNAILSSGLAQDPDLKMTVIFPATETVKTQTPERQRRSSLKT